MAKIVTFSRHVEKVRGRSQEPANHQGNHQRGQSKYAKATALILGSAEDRKVAYLLKVAEQSIHINPSLSQQYLYFIFVRFLIPSIKAQCICRKYDICRWFWGFMTDLAFPAAFPYIFCSHCACLINTTNTTSYKIVTIPSKAKSKYHNRIVGSFVILV